MGGDAADAVPAGIKALRAFAKAPSHLVSVPVSRHDPRARRPPLEDCTISSLASSTHHRVATLTSTRVPRSRPTLRRRRPAT